MAVKTVVIPPEAEGMKTGMFLRRFLPSLPESTVRKVFSARDVKLDGTRVSRDTPVHAGQTLSVYLPAASSGAESLRIVWEDEDILLVNKPAGISVEADEPGGLSLTDLCRLHAESVSGGSKGKSNCQGDDTVAIVRWLQDFASDPNGFKWASPDGWEADLNKDNKGALAVIGGAWHYNSAKAALGETNLGITLIPTFKLTDRAVEGLSTVKAGDEYRGGTFADCKCFMINANSAVSKYAKEQELIKYLSSKDVQNKSYLEVLNVPAYVGAADYIKQCFDEGKVSDSQYSLAAMQVGMAEWGIPQPFITGTLNTYYYSKNAPAVLRAIIDKTAYPTTGDQILSETESVDGIRKALYLVEYLWMHGVNPKEFPAFFPNPA